MKRFITAVSDLKEFQRLERRPLVRERNMFTFRADFSDERPLLETLKLFEVSHGSYQPFNFLPELYYRWSIFKYVSYVT